MHVVRRERSSPMSTLVHENVLAPDPAERDQIDALRSAIEHIAEEKEPVARLVAPDGTAVEIPASAFHALQSVVRDMAQGRTVLLIPHDRELTTQEAADMLNMSRQFFVRLLDRGEIPYHRTGTHRRVSASDVVAYRERRNARRGEGLDELTRMSEEVEGGYR
jgi:excisionase family DNA binding protein